MFMMTISSVPGLVSSVCGVKRPLLPPGYEETPEILQINSKSYRTRLLSDTGDFWCAIHVLIVHFKVFFNFRKPQFFVVFFLL